MRAAGYISTLRLRNAALATTHSGRQPASPCRTALHIAASCGHLACVKLLLGAGASALCLTEFGQTPAHLAAENGQCVDATMGTLALPTPFLPRR